MSAIRLATAANVREFHSLVNALSTSDTGYTLDHDALQDEIGRFRVWCGNIGALQKGHSSLDYRLRDSPLLSSNVLKLLKELQDNIEAAFQIISGTRLPYEKQQQQPSDDDEDEDDDFFSEDEDEDEPGSHKTELEMRFGEIIDVIDNLYKLSVRIRQPTIRSRSLRAAAYCPKDPETQVDLLEQYAISDLQHIRELVRHLRMPNLKDGGIEDDGVLTSRFARAVTLRRRQFKYWKRHRDKLGAAPFHEESAIPSEADRPDVLNRHNTLQVQVGGPAPALQIDAPSQKTGRTLLSGTEATHYHQTLDDIVDSKSVTSYATTVRDAAGRSIQLPPPPKAADGEKDFECPICYIICPSRYSNQRSWRTHVLQDLQPYVCTYPDCDTPDQLFQSRRQWAEHEASHRKVWRCPEHPDAVFKTSAGLKEHFQQEHIGSMSNSQLESIIKVGETSTVDMRACPICYLPAESNQIGNHIANHLERMATFALPTGLHDDSDGASSQASRGGTNSKDSQDWSEATFSSFSDEDLKDTFEHTENLDSPSQADTTESSKIISQIPPVEYGLSAELLREIPNSTEDRMGILFAQVEATDRADDTIPGQSSHSNDGDGDEEDESSDSGSELLFDEAQEGVSKGLMPIITVDDLPTLSSMYRSGKLAKRDAMFSSDGTYNQLISFYVYDITRLKVDAIVNSGNCNLSVSKPEFTLNRTIHKAAGPGMATECSSLKRIKTGEAVLTKGYNLPCTWVIHAARPNNHYSSRGNDMELLANCYRNSLKLAMSHGIQTIAFPSLGSGGCGFPNLIAARTAIEEVRFFLDTNPSHPFKSIIFCPFTNVDAMTYLQTIPIYFPPTDHDEENMFFGDSDAKRAVLAESILDAYTRIQAVTHEIRDFRRHIAAFPGDLLSFLHLIFQDLGAMRTKLLESVVSWTNPVLPQHRNEQTNDLSKQTANYVSLICTVIQTISSGLTEVIELARLKADSGHPIYDTVWTDYNQYMKTSHNLDVRGLVELCSDFAHGLRKIVTVNASMPHEMNTISIRLEAWLTKTTGKEQHGVRQLFEEVMYTREFQRDTTVAGRFEVVKLHRIPTLTQLYQTDQLGNNPTFSVPSARLNDMICFINKDIRALEVDVIVNSTDPAFSGMGRLDRAIFTHAGSEMQEELGILGPCQEGDVRLSGGYRLPAKHVLHVVPPETYRTTSMDVLRGIYREILHQADLLKATSIAIPALGSGVLNYPRRDCASLAMKEVKRFLETREFNTSIEKIVFCVFGSNDEHVYKSLLPVYFPSINYDPKDTGTTGDGSSLQSLNIPENLDLSSPLYQLTSNSSVERHRRFGSGNLSASTIERPLYAFEEEALVNFEKHAETCTTCVEVMEVYIEGGNLCEVGYGMAQIVLNHLNMDMNQTVFSTKRVNDHRVHVNVPPNFRLSLEMLTAVEMSFRDSDRTRPFISVIQPWPGPAKHQKSLSPPLPGIEIVEPLSAKAQKLEKTHAYVCTWSEEGDTWEVLHRHACAIHIFPRKLHVHEPVVASDKQLPLLSLKLTPKVLIKKSGTSELTIEKARSLRESIVKKSPKILLRCTSLDAREILYEKIKYSAEKTWKYTSAYEEPQHPGEDEGLNTQLPDVSSPSKDRNQHLSGDDDSSGTGAISVKAQMRSDGRHVTLRTRNEEEMAVNQETKDVEQHKPRSSDITHPDKSTKVSGDKRASNSFTVPHDMWICGVCHQGIDLVHTRCPVCKHERDASDYGPGQMHPEPAREYLSVLASVVLSQLRNLDKGDGVNQKELAEEAKVTENGLTRAIQELYENQLIHSVPGKIGVWSAASQNQQIISNAEASYSKAALPREQTGSNAPHSEEDFNEGDVESGVVPPFRWICSICNSGKRVALSKTTCPVCDHVRDASDFMPGEQYLLQGSGSLSSLSYKLLMQLRSIPERIRGMHQDSLADQFNVTPEDGRIVLERLQTRKLVYPVEDADGVWAATERDSTRPGLASHFYSFAKYRDGKQKIEDQGLASKDEAKKMQPPSPISSPQQPPVPDDVDGLSSYLASADLPKAPNPAKPRPNTPELDHPPVSFPALVNLDVINVDDYFTYLDVPELPAGTVWTLIDRRVVSPRAVAEMTDAYMRGGIESVIVKNRLESEEVKRLAERTVKIRKGTISPTEQSYAEQSHAEQSHAEHAGNLDLPEGVFELE